MEKRTNYIVDVTNSRYFLGIKNTNPHRSTKCSYSW